MSFIGKSLGDKSVTDDADYVIRIHTDLHDIRVDEWNALLRARPSSTPFLSHDYLKALGDTGCATPHTGWQLIVLGLYLADSLQAACLLYVKSHSYGEYVFDWGWAQAYERHGIPYYPKLLGAIPFTPVTGPRLLGSPGARSVLLKAVESLAREHQLSSAHILFMDEQDQASAREAGWLMRQTIQFHWENRKPIPYQSFDDFLSSLHRDKRKKILQERRRVVSSGVQFRALRGADIDAAAWDFFYRCYTLTYQAHGSTPYLTPEFFHLLRKKLPHCWLMFIATLDGTPIAASLVGIDDEKRVAFGRYWGSTMDIPCLHFEACYYQPLAWCIERGYQRFEGGAQGEHKMARGLLPVVTWSAHWLAHPQFAKAIAEHLTHEGEYVTEHMQDLRARQPFKHPHKDDQLLR